MFFVRYNPSKEARSGLFTFVLFGFVFTLCLMADFVHGAESNPGKRRFIYPRIGYFGALNTLQGVNVDDARVVLEMNFGRQAVGGRRKTEPKLDIIPDAETAAELIQQNKLHSISIAVIDYILLRELVPIKPFYVASALTDSPLESYILLTAKDVDLEQLAGMTQRRLMVDSHSQWDIGRIWLETVLHQEKLPRGEQFFTSIQSADKPTRLVLPVFFKQAEACLVTESVYNTMVELNPQLDKKLHVALRSPGFIKSLVSIVDYLDPDFVAQMEDSLLNMHRTEDGRQLMMIFRHRRYFPFKPEFLMETERIFNQFRDMNPELHGKR